jgi:hypothetical protein
VYFVIGKIKRAFALQEEFEDTKGVIRIRISKKNRQNNGLTLFREIRISCDTIWGGKNITSLYLERRQYLVVLFRGGDTILRHYFGR